MKRYTTRLAMWVALGALALTGCDDDTDAATDGGAGGMGGGVDGGGMGGEGGEGGAGGSQDMGGMGGIGGMGGEGGMGGAPADPLYALSVEVRTPEGSAEGTYVQTVDAVPSGAVDNDTAFELSGIGRVFSDGESVYLADGGAPALTRYAVGDDGELTESGRISFAEEGVTFITNTVVFVSPTKAYYLSNEILEVIIWDPSQMTITGSIDFSELQREGFTDQNQMTVAPEVVRDGMMYAAVTYSELAAGRFERGVQMAVFDTSDDSLVGVIEDERCDGAGVGAGLGDDGAIYVHADNFLNFLSFFDDTAGPTCVLRIPAGAMGFDPDYQVDLPDLTGGLNTSRFGFGTPTRSYVMALRDDLVQEARDLSRSPVLELWEVDLIGETGRKIEGAPLSTLFAALFFRVDGTMYVGLSDVFDASTVWSMDLATGEAQQAFTTPGLFRNFFRLR